MTAPERCPACAGRHLREMATIGPVPVLCGSLWGSLEEAVATPTADLDLVGCDSCGHVWNQSFDPSLVQYDAQYDNALDFSPTFRAYAESLAEHLVETFDLRGRRVAEIGSGKGEFLRQLAAAGAGRGIGFDPTYEGPDREGDIEFVREFFTPATSPGDTAFVCCRHVLEHLEDPHTFLLDVRAAVGDAAVPMYFEVPNADFNFSESGPWDLIYPHVAYFSADSLHAVLTRAGFHVRKLEECFNGQFLGAEVVPRGSADRLRADRGMHDGREATSRQVELDRQRSETARWRDWLADHDESGSLALWGAGSKGVTFLSLVDPHHRVGTVIDANPRKWGRFLPGSGHEVVSTREVLNRRVETVLVMNAAYAEEIQMTVKGMGSTAVVITVG